MSVCFYSVFVLFCAQVAALRQADSSSKESYQLCMDEETEKAAKVHKGCRVINREKANPLLILCYGVIIKELIGAHTRIIMKFPTFYANRCLIVMVKRDSHFTLFFAS
jgi:hypothetical protein